MASVVTKTPEHRFGEKIWYDPETGCIEWMAFKSAKGYAYFWMDAAVWRSHRWAYEAMHGSIPEGLALDHLCRNRGCVNPDHLEPVTFAENARRGRAGHINRAKTHCPRGHEYTPENTRLKRDHRHPNILNRNCRSCERIYDALRRERKMEIPA